MAEAAEGTSTTMNDIIRIAIASILNESIYLSSSPRIVLARECASVLLERLDETPTQTFVGSVERRLNSLIADSLNVTQHSLSKRREKLWILFYAFRASELNSLWKSLLVQMKLPRSYEDPWLVQTVTRKALEKLIAVKCPIPDAASENPKHLTADEHNALRYAAGYVFCSLKKKYAISNPSLSAWLKQQTDSSGTYTGDSYTQFTKVWLEKVNRGGLFLVSDCVYDVFVAMELVLRQFLKATSEGLDKEKVISVLHEDDEVQFHWSMMTFDVDSDTSQKVLIEVIKLWITIRGFSYAGAIVQEYKLLNSVYLKQKKSLRKELKKADV